MIFDLPSSVQASKGSRGLLSIRYIACLHATTIMVCYYHLYATALQFASHRSDDVMCIPFLAISVEPVVVQDTFVRYYFLCVLAQQFAFARS